MKEMNQKVAVIGAGYWGKNLVRNFYELGALKAICDLDTQALASHQERYPNIATTVSFDEILADFGISAVVIATPAATHYELAKKALLASKDVFVEKPLTLMVSEGEELTRLARERGRILMVDHLLHYHPAIEKLKTLVQRGELGEIQYVYSNRLGFGKLRREENVIWSFTPHDISLTLSFVEELPQRVSVHGGSWLQKGIFDVTVTNFVFSRNIHGHIFASWLHPYKDQKFIIVGSEQMAVFDDISEQKLVLYPHKVEWKGDIPVARKAKQVVVSLVWEEPLRRACRHFLECVHDRQKPLTDGEEAVRVLKVLRACQESLENSGQDVYVV